MNEQTKQLLRSMFKKGQQRMHFKISERLLPLDIETHIKVSIAAIIHLGFKTSENLNAILSGDTSPATTIELCVALILVGLFLSTLLSTISKKQILKDLEIK